MEAKGRGEAGICYRQDKARVEQSQTGQGQTGHHKAKEAVPEQVSGKNGKTVNV